MEPNGRDDGRDRLRRFDAGSVVPSQVVAGDKHASDLVFDFSGLRSPELTDLAMILTARLHAAPGERVWVRALSLGAWSVLRALGLDHLFKVYPVIDQDLN